MNGESEEFAIDLTDFAREMYEAGANAVTLIFTSGSAEGTTVIKSLDFSSKYAPFASSWNATPTYEQKDGAIDIYPQATGNSGNAMLFGSSENNFLPHFTTADIGRTFRITFRARASAAAFKKSASFGVGMYSLKSRMTPAAKEDGTKDEADTAQHMWVPYLVQTCTLNAADEWQTFTFEFTVDAYMTEKYVTAWGSNSYVSINQFGFRTYEMNPTGSAVSDHDKSAVLSVDDLVAEEVTGSTTITLIDKAKGTLVSDKGYGEASASGISAGKEIFTSNGNGKPLTIKPAVNNDKQAPNANQSVLIGGLIDGWRYNPYQTIHLGKTFRITFTASATEAGVLDLGLLAGWTEAGKNGVHNVTDGVKSANYRNDFYPNTQTSVRLTPTARTYSFEFTVAEGMLPENLLASDGTTVSGSRLALAIKFYNGFRENGKYKDVTITLDNFMVYEVQKSAYAEVDSGIRVADFETDTFGPEYYYFETRYMNEEDTSPVFRDTFGRVEDAENAHGGSYVSVLKSTRVNNFPFWTRLLPTSYTEDERGNTYSVSFWMKATKTGQFKTALTCAYKGNYYNLNNLEQAQTFTVTEANVWTRYTYTYTVGDAQLQADKPAVYLAIHPFAMGQSNEFRTVGDKRVFVSEDPVYMYFDDITVRKTVSPLTETNLSVSSALGVSEGGNSDALSVVAAPSVANANIKRTYLTFAPYAGGELYEALLRLPVLKAAGQTVRIYALYGASLPASLTYATAPIPAGTPIATFTASVGETVIDVTDVVLAANGASVTFLLVVDEGGEDVEIDNTGSKPSLTYGFAKGSDFDITKFKVKSNITLYSDFLYNAYVPVTNEVKEITLDGVSLPLYLLDRVTIDGADFYRVTEEVAAKNGTDSFALRVTIDDGESARTASYTLSIPSYARKVLNGEQSAEAKALMKDMLSYISAATVYFGTSDETTRKAIEEVLGADYDGSLDPDRLPAAVRETEGLESACLELDATPSFIFYIADKETTESFRFFSDDAPLTFEAKVAEDGRVYFKVTTYAYGMVDTIRYTYTDAAGRAHSGAYNLAAYYAGVSDTTKALVLALAGYSASATAYRNSVIR